MNWHEIDGGHEQKSVSSEEADLQPWDATSWASWAYNSCKQIQVMSINGVENAGGSEQTGEPEDQDMDPWQQYFSKFFPKLFTRTGKIRNYNVQAEFFQKYCNFSSANIEQFQDQRVPVTLQDKVDKEIDKLLI